MPPKKKKTRAYLEEALAAAKKQLPGWQYALIHAAAFPRSGARARHNPDMLEKLAIQQISTEAVKGARSSELKKLFGDLSKFFNAARRKNQDSGYFERKGKTIFNELKRRGVDMKGALADACKGCEESQKAADEAPIDPLAGAFDAFAESGNPEDIVNNVDFVAKYYDGGLYLEDLNGDRRIGDAQTDLEVEDGDTLTCRVERGYPVVLGFADAALADLADEAAVAVAKAAEIEKARDYVPFLGSDAPKVTFVGANPGPIEAARKEALVGPDGVTFRDVYLAPLSIAKEDIAIGFVNPANVGSDEVWAVWFQKEIDRLKQHGPIVALGKSAKETLGDRADFVLPHPSAVRRFGNSGEVDRKVKNIKKAIDLFSITPQNAEESVSNQSDTEASAINPTDTNSGSESGTLVKLTKAAEEKQIVYGVVLDPYVIDAHNDWIPPAEVERTAHGFVKDSRVIGLQHREAATAKVVESWIESYPTPFDYEQALANKPHKVTRRQFGDDVIHSGTWVLGVELADQEWEAFKSGTFTGFSIGGTSFKTPMSDEVMPEIEFVELTSGT